ncbi:hypothetical protein [Aeromonas veronii]|nr:hypothetical protein [Aeromonas veronii]
MMLDAPFTATAAAVVALAFLDRFIWKRGKVTITELRKADREGNYLRYLLKYEANSEPEWSELRYSFRDRRCPTTVIAGKTRTLDGCKAGENAEYLLIRDDLLTPGEWDLTVQITTVSRRNPFYSLFPFSSRATIEETIADG